jgi:hypothetical protein
LRKKRILCIPTAGQPEQEYLAQYWTEKAWIHSLTENEVEANLKYAIEKL